MSEARLLSLVMSYPHPTALARQVCDGSVFAALRRLEAHGYVGRRRGQYRLTRHGREELAMTLALTALAARTSRPLPYSSIARMGQCSGMSPDAASGSGQTHDSGISPPTSVELATRPETSAM